MLVSVGIKDGQVEVETGDEREVIAGTSMAITFMASEDFAQVRVENIDGVWMIAAMQQAPYLPLPAWGFVTQSDEQGPFMVFDAPENVTFSGTVFSVD